MTRFKGIETSPLSSQIRPVGRIETMTRFKGIETNNVQNHLLLFYIALKQ